MNGRKFFSFFIFWRDRSPLSPGRKPVNRIELRNIYNTYGVVYTYIHGANHSEERSTSPEQTTPCSSNTPHRTHTAPVLQQDGAPRQVRGYSSLQSNNEAKYEPTTGGGGLNLLLVVRNTKKPAVSSDPSTTRRRERTAIPGCITITPWR